ncbi:MAG: ribbon-helix-helix domain-containing protein [Kiritimatiellia bacterium]
MSAEPDKAAPEPTPEPSGPRKPPKPPKKTATGFADDGPIFIPEDVLEKLHKLAKERGKSVGDLMKEAFKQFFGD